MKKKIVSLIVFLVLLSVCSSEAWNRQEKHHRNKDSVICMSWEDKTSTTYWTDAPNYAGTWTGTAWESEDVDESQDVNIGVVGTWATGYEPVKIRVTFTGDPLTLTVIVIDTNNDEITPAYSFVSSGGEVTLTFGSYNIDRLWLLGGEGKHFQVTKIEFLAPLLNGVYKSDIGSYCGVLMSDISKIDGVDK